MRKLKNLLITIAGLSLSLGAAIGVGLSSEKKQINEASAISQNDFIYAHAKNPADFGEITRVHLWGSSGNYTEWNSDPSMSRIGSTNTYYYKVTSDPTNKATSGIFRSNSHQSGDLNLTLNGKDPHVFHNFNYNSTDVDKAELCTWALATSLNEWSKETNQFSFSTSGEYSHRYYIQYHFSTSGEFKIVNVDNNKWHGSHSTSIAGISGVTCNTSGDNFSVASPGTLTIWMTPTINAYGDADYIFDNVDGQMLFVPDPQYTITKMAVEFIDGIAQSPADWNLGADSVYSGQTYAIPSGVQKNLEHFEGWFTNEACTTPYTDRAITGNLTIYAKYTRLTLDSYFFWTDKDSAVLTNVYFFGDYCPVAWPGTALSTYKVDDVLSFNAEGKLYKIPVPSSGSFQVIFNSGNDSYKTGDSPVTDKGFVWTYDANTESSGTHWYGTSWSTDAGAAADVVEKVESARNSVHDVQGKLDYSLCNISSTDAKNFYNQYYNLTNDQKGFVDRSCTYTYVGAWDGDAEHIPSQDNILFSAIMPQLRAIADADPSVRTLLADYVAKVPTSVISNDSGNNTTLLVVVGISAVSLVAVGGYFFIRKRKEF